MSRYVSLIGSVLVLLGCSAALAADAKDEKAVVFEVPTTGEIMDVTYIPEFEEWWVKCREGKAISVYSYDKHNKKWGRARFIPVPPGEKAAKGKEPVKPAPGKASTDQTAAPPAEKDGTPPKPEETQPEAKPSEPKEPQTKHQKWWDPFGLLKEKK